MFTKVTKNGARMYRNLATQGTSLWSANGAKSFQFEKPEHVKRQEIRHSMQCSTRINYQIGLKFKVLPKKTKNLAKRRQNLPFWETWACVLREHGEPQRIAFRLNPNSATINDAKVTPGVDASDNSFDRWSHPVKVQAKSGIQRKVCQGQEVAE